MDLYNHTRKILADGDGVTVTLAALKVMLVGAGYTFDPTETVMSVPAAEEVSGNGWDAGGEALGSAAITTVNTNEAKLDGADISVAATGGDIGPASGFVILDSTGANAAAWRPLFYYEFAAPQTAGVGTDFKITWHADGIHVWENV